MSSKHHTNDTQTEKFRYLIHKSVVDKGHKFKYIHVFYDYVTCMLICNIYLDLQIIYDLIPNICIFIYNYVLWFLQLHIHWHLYWGILVRVQLNDFFTNFIVLYNYHYNQVLKHIVIYHIFIHVLQNIYTYV